MYKRVIATGDIHGCFYTLQSLMEQVDPTSEDLLVFTGDYVDRGNHSFKVIDYLIALKEKFPQTIFIKGNHEDLFIGHLLGDMTNSRMFFYNGGHSTINSYNESLGFKPSKMEDLPQSHQDFLNNLVPIFEHGDFIFVHGGLRPGYTVDQQEDHDLIWIRDEFLWEKEYKWGKTVVHGHTPMVEDELEKYHMIHQNKINLDSGCVFGYELTSVNVLTRHEWTQKMAKLDNKRSIY